MDDLTPYDIKLLIYLDKFEDGVSEEKLVDRFGKEAPEALCSLKCNGIVKREFIDSDYETVPNVYMAGFPTGNWKIDSEGRLLLKRHESVLRKRLLNSIKEKSWLFVSGLISGILVGVIAGTIVGYLLFKHGWK